MENVTLKGINASKTFVVGLALLCMSLGATAQNKQSEMHRVDPVKVKIDLDQKVEKAKHAKARAEAQARSAESIKAATSGAKAMAKRKAARMVAGKAGDEQSFVTKAGRKVEMHQPTTVSQAALKAMKKATSVTETTYLDSTVTRLGDGTNESKTIYSYDEQGRSTGETYYNWYNNRWVGSWKNEYAYDDNGRDILYAFYYFDTESDSWIGSYKIEHQYKYIDGYYEMVLCATYDGWDTTINDWRGSSKEVYEYDDNGDLSFYVCYSGWDETNHCFIGSEKIEYAYDDNGHEILYASYYWNTDKAGWIGSYKNEYAYDDNGNQTLYASYNWDTEKAEWVGSYKGEHAYDDNGNRTLYASYNWDTENAMWVGNDKYESVYGDNGYRSGYTNYIWDYTAAEWTYLSNMEYEYDNYDNVTKHTFNTDWDSANNTWGSSDTYAYDITYDNYGQIIESVCYHNGEVSAKTTYEYDATTNLIMSSLTCYWADGKWTNLIKTTYTYDENGNMTLYENAGWNGNEWLTTERDVFKYETYDGGIYQTLYANYSYDDVNNMLIGNFKWEYGYTVIGNGVYQTLDAYYDGWNTETNNWSSGYKYEYGYMEINGLAYETSYARYNWDGENECFVGSYKNESNYDEAGNYLGNISYNWDTTDGGQWVASSKYVIEIDATTGNTICEASYYWDSDSQSWIGNSISEYGYDERGWAIMNTYRSGWNTETNSWDYGWKTESTRDENGTRTSATNYEWVSATSTWKPSRKNEWAYDDNGNQILNAVYYSWDEDQQTWSEGYKEECSYNNGQLAYITQYNWDVSTKSFIAYYAQESIFDSNGYITSLNNYTYVDGEKTPDSITTYYYSTQSEKDSGIADITIDGSKGTVRIYDMQGRERTSLGEGINIVKANGKTMKIVKGK